jgi:hypothetical protein
MKPGLNRSWLSQSQPISTLTVEAFSRSPDFHPRDVRLDVRPRIMPRLQPEPGTYSTARAPYREAADAAILQQAHGIAGRRPPHAPAEPGLHTLPSRCVSLAVGDGTVPLLDAATGRERAALRGHGERVYRIARAGAGRVPGEC